LRFVSEVLLRDTGTAERPFVLESSYLRTCESLIKAWKAYLEKLKIGSRGPRLQFVIASYDKGTRSLFDYTCDKCDKEKGDIAISDWWERVSSASESTPPSVLRNLRRYARKLLGGGWARKASEDERIEGFWEREDDIPDVKACNEKRRSEGGTFSAQCRRDVHAGSLRVTVAKSKSKYRVVTCQPAFVKRALHRAMRYFYDRISKNRWCIRGDVNREHFETLERKKGQLFVSGDYSASTDYLNRDAVLEVVAAMCEVLDETTADVLMRSFKELQCEGRGAIRRGSMMGSKCSFVVLCVLNAFVVDNALGNVDEFGDVVNSETMRPKLINGDDSAFTCNDKEFSTWLQYASWVGFRVNLDKTMRNDRFVEINSQVYDSRHGVIPKPSFGFLRGATNEIDGDGTASDWNEDPWDALFKTLQSGIRHFAVKAYVLTHPLVRLVLVGCRRKPNLLVIPKRWHTFLFRKKWFRSLCVLEGDVPEETTDHDRRIDYVYGPLLADEEEHIVERAEEASIIRYKRKWDGVPYKPERPRRVKTVLPDSPIRIARGPVVVKRLWIKEVWEEFMDVLEFDFDRSHLSLGWTWRTLLLDDKRLSARRDPVISRNDRRAFAPPLRGGWIGEMSEEGQKKWVLRG